MHQFLHRKDRVKTLYITVNIPENVERVEQIVNMDISADSIRSIVKQEELKGVVVKVRYFQKGDNVDIDETEWAKDVVRVIPSTVDNTTKILKIIEVREPEPKTLKEAKGTIISSYQTQLEADWLESLKEKYPVTINEKVLEKVRKQYQ